MCRPCSLGVRTREATCAGRPRHLPLARALRDLRLRPSPVTPSRQVLPARSSLPSVRLLLLFRVGRPQQWIARAPSGGGAANAARVDSLCERRDKPTPMTRTCCIAACHSVRARAWPATQRILHEACVSPIDCCLTHLKNTSSVSIYPLNSSHNHMNHWLTPGLSWFNRYISMLVIDASLSAWSSQIWAMGGIKLSVTFRSM